MLNFNDNNNNNNNSNNNNNDNNDNYNNDIDNNNNSAMNLRIRRELCRRCRSLNCSIFEVRDRSDPWCRRDPWDKDRSAIWPDSDRI